MAAGPLPTPPLYYWPGFTPCRLLIGRASQFSHPAQLLLAESRVTGPATVILLGASVNSPPFVPENTPSFKKSFSCVKDLCFGGANDVVPRV